MMNFNNKITRNIVSSVIIILLVLAMVAPMVLGALSMERMMPLSGGSDRNREDFL